jgi:hypothetical protein
MLIEIVIMVGVWINCAVNLLKYLEDKNDK